MEKIILSKKITMGRELVVVPKKDFEEFKKWKTEIQMVLQKVKRGRAEYKLGKTIVASSPHSFR